MARYQGCRNSLYADSAGFLLRLDYAGPARLEGHRKPRLRPHQEEGSEEADYSLVKEKRVLGGSQNFPTAVVAYQNRSVDSDLQRPRPISNSLKKTCRQFGAVIGDSAGQPGREPLFERGLVIL